MNEIDQIKFEQTRTDTENFYRKIGEIWCPYFQEKIMRHVTYYEFVAIVNEVRVRVIIKQIEDGQKYFWSIIPFWKMNKITGSRILYAGKPETD